MSRLTIPVLAALLAACADPTQTQSILDLTGDAAAGAVIYDGTCALCHGATGEGTNLGVALAATPRTQEEIVIQVLTGNDQGMASAADYGLTDQDVADVTAHVLSL